MSARFFGQPLKRFEDARLLRGQGMFVERTADSVVVYFDTETLRTRFDWKFEGVVRATLPTIFPQAQAALAAIPTATLSHGADLLTDLTRRGIRLDLGAQAGSTGGALMLWPREANEASSPWQTAAVMPPVESRDEAAPEIVAAQWIANDLTAEVNR